VDNCHSRKHSLFQIAFKIGDERHSWSWQHAYPESAPFDTPRWLLVGRKVVTPCVFYRPSSKTLSKIGKICWWPSGPTAYHILYSLIKFVILDANFRQHITRHIYLIKQFLVPLLSPIWHPHITVPTSTNPIATAPVTATRSTATALQARIRYLTAEILPWTNISTPCDLHIKCQVHDVY